MGYRRLKEKVKEYNRRDAKFYGNIIEKLSKAEADVSSLFRHLVSMLLLGCRFTIGLLLPGLQQEPGAKQEAWPVAFGNVI